MELICPSCGAPYNPGDNFCDVCGNVYLVTDTCIAQVWCPNGCRVMDPAARICATCGARIVRHIMAGTAEPEPADTPAPTPAETRPAPAPVTPAPKPAPTPAVPYRDTVRKPEPAPTPKPAPAPAVPYRDTARKPEPAPAPKPTPAPAKAPGSRYGAAPAGTPGPRRRRDASPLTSYRAPEPPKPPRPAHAEPAPPSRYGAPKAAAPAPAHETGKPVPPNRYAHAEPKPAEAPAVFVPVFAPDDTISARPPFEPPVEVPEPPAPAPDVVYCPNGCTNVDPNGVFCDTCGARLMKPFLPSTPPKPPVSLDKEPPAPPAEFVLVDSYIPPEPPVPEEPPVPAEPPLQPEPPAPPAPFEPVFFPEPPVPAEPPLQPEPSAPPAPFEPVFFPEPPAPAEPPLQPEPANPVPPEPADPPAPVPDAAPANRSAGKLPDLPDFMRPLTDSDMRK